jgi:type I restriction enzyme M protein
MSSQQSGEGDIRKALIEKDVVDCMVALPGQLFYSTQIPACLWFLARDKSANGHRNRKGEILFIDARNLGHMVDRTRREFSEGSDGDIATITRAYHRWRAKPEAGLGEYQDIPGFCASATLEDVRKKGHVLTPGRYVGAKDQEDDGILFADRIAQFRERLSEQFEISAGMQDRITQILLGNFA